MREQNLQRDGARGLRSGDCVTAMLGRVVMRAVLRDAAEEHGLARMVQHGVLIEQHLQPQAAPLGHPRIDAVVIFVIARDTVRAMVRAQIGERRDV